MFFDLLQDFWILNIMNIIQLKTRSFLKMYLTVVCRSLRNINKTINKTFVSQNHLFEI